MAQQQGVFDLVAALQSLPIEHQLPVSALSGTQPLGTAEVNVPLLQQQPGPPKAAASDADQQQEQQSHGQQAVEPSQDVMASLQGHQLWQWAEAGGRITRLSVSGVAVGAHGLQQLWQAAEKHAIQHLYASNCDIRTAGVCSASSSTGLESSTTAGGLHTGGVPPPMWWPGFCVVQAEVVQIRRSAYALHIAYMLPIHDATLSECVTATH